MEVYFSNGGGFDGPYTLVHREDIVATVAFNYNLFLPGNDYDIDGDTIPDYFSILNNPNSLINPAFFSTYGFNKGKSTDRLQTIVDGLDTKTDINYKNIVDSSVYTPGIFTAYPIRGEKTNYVVSDVYKDQGANYSVTRSEDTDQVTAHGGAARYTYQYSGARTDLSGRGNLGFHSFVTFDHQTNLLNYQFLSQSFPTTGLVKREQTYRADGVVYDVDGNVTSLDLQPITSQDNDVVFDEVLEAPGGDLTGSVFPFMSHSRELRWEFSIPNPLTLEADDPESLFTEYNNEYTANRALAHSEIETYVWFDEQDTVSLPETELQSAFDDPATAPPGAQDASPVGFIDWLDEVPNFGLPQEITFGNVTRTRIDYSDNYRTDTYTSYYDPAPTNGNRTDLANWTQIVANTPAAIGQGSPVTRFTYNSKGKVETKTTDALASSSANRAAPVLNALADTRLNTKETYTYTTTGLTEKIELEDFTSDALYDIDGGTRFPVSEVTEFDATGRFPKTVENAYGHATTTTYDNFGRPTVVTDFNGEHIATDYDGLGRVTQSQDLLRNLTTTITLEETEGQSGVLGPQAVTVPSEINGTGLALTSKYYSREESSGEVPVTTHYDRLGRVIRVISEGYAGTVTLTDTIYDIEGQVVALSNPYEQEQTAYWTFTTYDEMGRLSTATAPNGTLTTNTYRGRLVQTTVDAPAKNGVDPDPQVETVLNNVRGEPVEIWNADNPPTSTSQTAGDSDPSIEFIYDGFGRMTETRTRQGTGDYVSLTSSYDALGNQTQLVDPDKGQWDYVYDALGRNRQQTDAKQTVTTNTFDILNRNLSRTIAEANSGPVETTNWYFYDTAANSSKPHVIFNLGQGWIGAVQREDLSLAWATTPGDPLRNYSNANSFYYDDRGNNYLMVQNLDDKWFYTHTVFDSLSRPEAVTHFWRPPNLESDNTQQPGVWQSYGYATTYDNKSYITEVTDTQGKVWWRADTSDGYDYMDRPVLFQKGGPSGAWTEQQYDPQDGSLRFTTTGDLSGGSPQSGIQDNEYRYDALGNLVYRSDSIRGNTETFSYDVLSRLEDASVGSTTLAYTYHPNGNIKTKENVSGSDGGSYAYHATKVHAVTSAFGYTIGYDNNGNVNSRTGNGETWSFKWAGFDKPRWMGREKTTDTRGSAFLYGPSQMRVAHYEFEAFEHPVPPVIDEPGNWMPAQFTKKKLYLADGAVEVDYKNATPAGPDDWEMQTILVTIPSPGNNVGIAEFDPEGTSSADHKYLVYHYDHLGSIQAITDWGASPSDTPAKDESGKDSVYSYDPWGQRRDTGDWQGEAASQSTYTWGADDPTTALTNEDDLIPRGYTGHEMIDDLGLVHMNGRIYDPQLGRFLSADLLIEDIFNLQTFNRYSYVLNNPLTRIDITGYNSAIAADIFVGGFKAAGRPLPRVNSTATARAGGVAGAVMHSLTAASYAVGGTQQVLRASSIELSKHVEAGSITLEQAQAIQSQVIEGTPSDARSIRAKVHIAAEIISKGVATAQSADNQTLAQTMANSNETPDEEVLSNADVSTSGAGTGGIDPGEPPEGDRKSNNPKRNDNEKTITSRIKENKSLVKEANKLGGGQQKSADNLVDQLKQGNMNPGIGTKEIKGLSGVFEARARDGARVYFRNTSEGGIEILGKSTKGNQQKVIDLIKKTFF
ncbi:MAG: RHS repeat-associated core domain-containing protein [Verrucomicrobiota bacterium]